MIIIIGLFHRSNFGTLCFQCQEAFLTLRPWQKFGNFVLVMPETAFPRNYGKASLSPEKINGKLSGVAGKVFWHPALIPNCNVKYNTYPLVSFCL